MQQNNKLFLKQAKNDVVRRMTQQGKKRPHENTTTDDHDRHRYAQYEEVRRRPQRHVYGNALGHRRGHGSLILRIPIKES